HFPPCPGLFAAFALEPFIRRARERYTSRAPVAAEVEPVTTTTDEGDTTTTDEGARPPEPARVERARAWELILVGTAFVLLAAPMVWYARVTSQDIAAMAPPNFYPRGK